MKNNTTYSDNNYTAPDVRREWRTTHSLWRSLGIGSLILMAGCSGSISHAAAPQNDETVFLNQGWDQQTRQKLSFTSFGSRVIPYDWFLALEQAGNNNLFRDSTHLASLGFISAAADEYNPDGLPVGMVRDKDKKKGDAIGFTCAACHTGQVSINGQRVRIDGGQALIDFSGFEQALVAALEATLNDAEKFSRFFTGVSQAQSTQTQSGSERASLSLTTQALQMAVQERLKQLQQRLANNKTQVPYGYGRLDAFGQIFNAIAVEALNMPENIHAPNAPTSYPVLWDASHLDLVQWNASAPNKEPGPLFQNAITALAVYGTIDIKRDYLTYPSSVRIHHLADIQNAFYQLTAPSWPEELAGALDKTKMAAGKTLYDKHCLECHSLVDATDKKRKLRAVLTPVSEVGTDPLMAANFSQNKVKTGVLEGERSMILLGKKLPAEVNSLELVAHAAAGAMFNQPWQTVKAIAREYHANYSAERPEIDSYKARPLNGVWASAPYLHNGSVPSIYDLLLPAAQRPQQFYVGNIALDVNKVGYVTSETANSSLFDTRLPGNSNAGHEYGTALSDEERWALVEYIKSL